MSYSEDLATRIRAGMAGIDHITEKRMFGGLSFLYKGKMTVGIVKERLCARVVSEKCEELLSQEGIAPMDFTGKPLKEFMYVSQDLLRTEEDVQNWIELGLEHAKRALKE